MPSLLLTSSRALLPSLSPRPSWFFDSFWSSGPLRTPALGQPPSYSQAMTLTAGSSATAAQPQPVSASTFMVHRRRVRYSIRVLTVSGAWFSGRDAGRGQLRMGPSAVTQAALKGEVVADFALRAVPVPNMYLRPSLPPRCSSAAAVFPIVCDGLWGSS